MIRYTQITFTTITSLDLSQRLIVKNIPREFSYLLTKNGNIMQQKKPDSKMCRKNIIFRSSISSGSVQTFFSASRLFLLVSFCMCVQTGVTEKLEDTQMTVINKCSLTSESVYIDSDSHNDEKSEKTEAFEHWTFAGSQVLRFRLTTVQPNCSFGEILYINWTRQNGEKTNEIKNLTSQGDLIWQDSDGYLHSSSPREYCVDLDIGEDVTFAICKSGCTIQEPCVRKCCPPDSIIDPTTKTCNQTTKAWKPFFYSATNHQADEQTEYTVTYGIPSCEDKYLIQLFKTSEVNNKGDIKLNLLLNGSLVQINGKSTVLNPGEFCIDGYPYHSGSSHGKVNYSGSEWDQLAIVCHPPKCKLCTTVQKFKHYFTTTLLTISALCLLLTDIVYLILWKYKNIHEWLQFCCATSFFFAFSALVIAIIWFDEIRNMDYNLCTILGSLIHFSFLSAFFWMTSMNFDLWFRFSGCRLFRTRSRPTGDKKKFLYFAMFSLGFPFLFASGAVSMDLYYRNNPFAAPIPIPQFGELACYFSSKRSEFPYAKGPEAVLFSINIIFFTSTVIYLKRYQRNTELARTNSNSEDRIGRFRLFSKLFIVMGVLWIFEFISWAVDVSFPENPILNSLLFLPPDAINSLQGVAIFIIYVCKPNIFNQLKVALGCR